VTHEAVRKSRKAARRAAQQAGRVYLTGCAARLPRALAGLPENVSVVTAPPERAASAISSSVGAIGCLREALGQVLRSSPVDHDVLPIELLEDAPSQNVGER
jgi:hypothetical protein